MHKMKKIFHRTSGHFSSSSASRETQRQQQQNDSNYSYTEKPWLDLRYRDSTRAQIKRPAELENEMLEPPSGAIDQKMLDKIQGSIIGMALGDALGAHVEFRPRQYLLDKPVTDLEGGGTWGLQKGQFTDDTSMALCLANSLVTKCTFNPYDQLVRYKWWYRYGYMSSTGECFDIGTATSQSIAEFEQRQIRFAKKFNIPTNTMDFLDDNDILKHFDTQCSQAGAAGNGALMRLAPVPLFFFQYPEHAVEYSGISGEITHGDKKAYDACRYYGALIVAVLHGYSKKELLDRKFYSKNRAWFGSKPLCSEIVSIAEGSFKRRRGYDDGIRGKGYVVDALEAALWAFWSDGNSFEQGALHAVNLGDDTDTTAAIYGQLAGAYYGYRELPRKWLDYVYAQGFMANLSRWIVYEGQHWHPAGDTHAFDSHRIADANPSREALTNGPHPTTHLSQHAAPHPVQPFYSYPEQLSAKHRESQQTIPTNHPSLPTNSNPKLPLVPKPSSTITATRATDRRSIQPISNGGALRPTRSLGAQQQFTSAVVPTNGETVESNSKSPSRPTLPSVPLKPIVSEKKALKDKLYHHQPDTNGYSTYTVAGTSQKRPIIEPYPKNGTDPIGQTVEFYHLSNVQETQIAPVPGESTGAHNRSSRHRTSDTKQSTKKPGRLQTRVFH